MNGRRFDDFLAQTRLNFDPDEHVIFIYDGAPAHRNPAIPGLNSELRKLPPYSPFLEIVEQAVSALKAAIGVRALSDLRGWCPFCPKKLHSARMLYC